MKEKEQRQVRLQEIQKEFCKLVQQEGQMEKEKEQDRNMQRHIIINQNERDTRNCNTDVGRNNEWRKKSNI